IISSLASSAPLTNTTRSLAQLAPRRGPVPQAEPTCKSITVAPGKQRLEFHFTGLSFASPEKVRFRYCLEGFDQTWVDAGSRRAAYYYSRINPGTYRFKVTACGNNGVWNENGAVLGLIVQPFWWETAWFRVLAGSGVAGLAFLFFELRILRLKRARAAQQVFSQRLIESQENERKRIAAELHDGLGQDLLVIKNRCLLALQDPKTPSSAQESLSDISRLASQTLQEVREISRNLRPYQLDRLGLTKALAAIVNNVERSSELQVTSELECLDGLFTPEHEIHLYRIVQEIFNNILKHSHARQACLTAKLKSQTLLLRIEDDGCGFDAALIAEQPSPEGSFGLTDITERVRILGGTWRCDSSSGTGVQWQLEIPLPPKYS
ncbi:MAG TPA: histidine kinase, partial [Bacillota bacterium]|nr:histidine kinase [Bacillota bacterium]